VDSGRSASSPFSFILLTGNVPVGGAVLPLGAILVPAWAHWSRTPWREIGYVRPRSWTITVAAGLVFGVAFKLLMKAVVMPLFGAPPINQAYHYLAGNRTLLPAVERLGRLFGSSVGAKVSIVLLTSAWFGLAHYTAQGIVGVEQATVVGLVFGTIYTITGRIWMLVFAHAAFGLTALALIYWNIESSVAHLVFKQQASRDQKTCPAATKSCSL
jgi:membrane protease YdiL (CAAX protease family)